MARCAFESRDGRRCPRPAHDGADRCAFHLSPAEREERGVGAAELRAAFRADVAAGEERREYVGVEAEALELGSLLVDGDDVGHIVFRDARVGEFDLSGSVVRHPLVFEDCEVGSLDATGATFGDRVRLAGSVLGDDGPTCLRCRRTAFEAGLEVSDTVFRASVELPACRVEGWLDFDGARVEGRAHFPNADLGMAQFVDSEFGDRAEFGDATASHLAFEGVRFRAPADLSGAAVETLRVGPRGDADCRLVGATVAGGRLDQPGSGRALYDLTEATVGDVTLDCADGFDRYRFYQTRFDGFPFAAYRRFLRASGWRIHEYAGTPATETTTEGLELTYLAARQGATDAGDGENAAAFLVQELRYRRRRYAAHARDPAHGLGHRVDAALRWLTNGFLDAVAGYGERPQRVVAVSLATIVGGALLYPATGGLTAGSRVVTYASDGPLAAVDGLYFSVVTFATLGLGDVHPAGTAARLVAASEALAGAFLTALFVFALGRRVSR